MGVGLSVGGRGICIYACASEYIIYAFTYKLSRDLKGSNLNYK